jgi:hypothetical protein
MSLNEYRTIMDRMYKSKSPIKIPSRDNSKNRKNSTKLIQTHRHEETTNKEECSTTRTHFRNRSDIKDIKTLMSFYKSDINSNITKSRNINNLTPPKIPVKKNEIEKIQSFMKSIKCNVEPTIIDKTYDNPVSSYRELQVNKELFNRINNIVISNQVDKYSNMIESFERSRLYKLKKIKCSSIDQVLNKMKPKDESDLTYTKKTREDYFIINNTLIARTVSFKNPPHARSQASLVCKSIYDANYVILFGGLGANRYNDVWLCDLSIFY